MPSTSASPGAILAFDINPVEVSAHLVLRQEDVFRWEGVGHARVRFTPNGVLDRRCLLEALRELRAATGRELLSSSHELINPADNHGRGVDKVCLTWSLPAPIRVILIGLMPGLSAQAGETLLHEMPVDVIARFTSTDERSGEDRIDTLLSNRPDLILLVGGTEGGADLAVREQVDLVVRAISTLPKELRPEVFYAGNSHLHEYLRANLEPVAMLTIAANVKPGISEDDLQPAREILSAVCSRLWLNKIKPQLGKNPLAMDMSRPRLRAIEDLTQVLTLSEKSSTGVLTVDLDGTATSVTTLRNGRPASAQIVPPDPAYLLERFPAEIDPLAIPAWSPEKITPEEVIDTITADALYPERLPASGVDIAIHTAMARVAGRKAWLKMVDPVEATSPIRTAWGGAEVDTLLITGPRIGYWKKAGQPLLEVLDILQPAGLVHVYLDKNDLAAVLGTAAHLDPRIPLHCILAGTLPRLATVIAPVFRHANGKKILTVRMRKEDGTETQHEVRSGELLSIPLAENEAVMLTLVPRGGASLGARTPSRTAIAVKGSRLGLVVDARGRPLPHSRKSTDQIAWMKKALQQAMELER